MTVNSAKCIALAAMLVVSSSGVASADHGGSPAYAIAYVGALGLTVVTGLLAMASHAQVSDGEGSYVTGTSAIVLGAPTAAIGTLITLRSLETGGERQNLVLGLSMWTLGLAAAWFGSQSVALAGTSAEAKSGARPLSITPALFATDNRAHFGLVLTSDF